MPDLPGLHIGAQRDHRVDPCALGTALLINNPPLILKLLPITHHLPLRTVHHINDPFVADNEFHAPEPLAGGG